MSGEEKRSTRTLKVLGHGSNKQLVAVAHGLLNQDSFGERGGDNTHTCTVDRRTWSNINTKEKELCKHKMKVKLGLDPANKIILVAGEGKGAASLYRISKKLFLELMTTCRGLDATVVVICGRNEKLKDKINAKDWRRRSVSIPQMKIFLAKMSKRSESTRTCRVVPTERDGDIQDSSMHTIGNVNVVGIGFVDNMEDFMIAADVLVSSAEPGTMAKAESLGLPLMVTSSLQGQEARNVNTVLDGQCTTFCKQPRKIAQIVASWLRDDAKLDEFGGNSAKVGKSYASSTYMKDIARFSPEPPTAPMGNSFVEAEGESDEINQTMLCCWNFDIALRQNRHQHLKRRFLLPAKSRRRRRH